MSREIEDLAEKGKRIRAERAAKLEARAAAELGADRAEERAKDHKRLWQSVSLFGMRGREVGEFYFVLVAMAVVGVATGWIFSKLGTTWGYVDREHELPIAGLAGAGLVLVWVIYQSIVPLPRERAWIAKLPFRVRGYELALSSYRGDNASELDLVFEWGSHVPEPQTLLDLLAIDGVEWKGGIARASREGIESSDSDHNRELRAWWRKLVTTRLLALHRSHPFATVTLLNARGRKLVDAANPHTSMPA